MTKKIALEINDINKTFKFESNNVFYQKNSTLEIKSLKNISLTINQSDRIGIIGRNGSGKSTLCKIIAGITYPTSGTIKIKGKVSSVLEAGIGFEPELSGYENIFLGGAVLGMGRLNILKKVDEIINFSEIKNYINVPLKKYSTGMMIKLAFSVACFLDGDIIILDEVLAVADENFRKKCVKKIINDCQKDNKTLLLVSHDIRNIAEICNKVIYLKEGELINFGDVKEIIKQYELEK